MSFKNKEYVINSIEDLEKVAKDLIHSGHSKIILLKGNLGVGKTTLVKVFCENLSSPDQVSSPTFSIVNEYSYPYGVIYHFDLYRLESMEEALEIGIEEYLDSGAYCLIEWPEIIKPLIGDTFTNILISVKTEKSRIISLSFE